MQQTDRQELEELRDLAKEQRKLVNSAWEEYKTAGEDKEACLQHYKDRVAENQSTANRLEHLERLLAAPQPVTPVVDVNKRFEDLLGTTVINRPDPDVLRRVRQDYAHRLAAVKDADDALDLYRAAASSPGSSTRRHMGAQHGLSLDGPLFTNPDVCPCLVTATDREGRPVIVKLIPKPDRNSYSREATAVCDICAAASQAPGLAIMSAKVVQLDLTREHEGTADKPGAYAAVVMPRYVASLVGLPTQLQVVMAKQGARLEQAVQFIHNMGLVHMDIKGANILVDVEGQWVLADFGGVVRIGEPIAEVSQQFAPLPQLCGQPARIQYDWHMLAVALAVELFPEEWLDQLCENDPGRGMYAPRRKLVTAINQAVSDPALVALFHRLLNKSEI